MISSFRIAAPLAIVALASIAACSESGSSKNEPPRPPQTLGAGGCLIEGDICINIDLSHKSDAGLDAAAPDAGRDGAPDTAGDCHLLNPKYKLEFDRAVLQGDLKQCDNGCATGECCYLGLSCLAK
ncbi:hypothetical protein [Pendulispora albinea]|uniref:Lipoprotein n=1 Tax=Pendulispora albinea TaxID=2741071 RepID=A0ABZ2LRY5_9BACT